MNSSNFAKLVVAGLVLVTTLAFALPSATKAEIPPNVTIKEVNVYGNYDVAGGESTYVEIKDGKVVYPENYYDGQWQAQVDSVEYNLDFWNVGEEGGTQGISFWKKEYAYATLTFNYNFTDAGKIAKGYDLDGWEAYQFEDAPSEPNASVTYIFKFSGGPYGFFTEVAPYVNGETPARGHIYGGENVTFDLPKKSGDTNSPYLLNVSQMDMPWKVDSNAFFGYQLTGNSACGESISRKGNRIPFAFIPTAQAVDSGARFTDFTGEVVVTIGGEEYPAELDMVLDEGARIETESDSCAIISFADMTTFIMKPFTTVIIDPAPPKQSKISLLTGKIWANVQKMYKDGSMDVTMNQAVAGTKGTTFVAEEDGTNSTLKVIEGLMEFRSKTSDEVTEVATGEMVTADANGLGEKSTFNAEDENSTWGNLPELITAIADTEGSLGDTAEAVKSGVLKYWWVGLLALLGLVGLIFFVRRSRKSNSI